jgi:hypothetical protein
MQEVWRPVESSTAAALVQVAVVVALHQICRALMVELELAIVVV